MKKKRVIGLELKPYKKTKNQSEIAAKKIPNNSFGIQYFKV